MSFVNSTPCASEACHGTASADLQIRDDHAASHIVHLQINRSTSALDILSSTEQALRAAQYALDCQMLDLQSEFLTRQGKLRDEYLAKVAATLAAGLISYAMLWSVWRLARPVLWILVPVMAWGCLVGGA
jgi:hypothetical protein